MRLKNPFLEELPKRPVKSESIRIMMRPEEKKFLMEYASKEETNMSEVVREALREMFEG